MARLQKVQSDKNRAKVVELKKTAKEKEVMWKKLDTSCLVLGHPLILKAEEFIRGNRFLNEEVANRDWLKEIEEFSVPQGNGGREPNLTSELEETDEVTYFYNI